jgi:hypothetical protein
MFFLLRFEEGGKSMKEDYERASLSRFSRL